MAMSDALQKNAQDLDLELQWLSRVIDVRFRLYFKQESDIADIHLVQPPDLAASSSPYAEFVQQHALSFDERIALVLALVPHIRPQLLDVFFTKNGTYDRRFTEFGGIFTEAGYFRPTGSTLAFVLGGSDLAVRFAVDRLFDPAHVFATEDVLRLQSEPGKGQALLDAPLCISDSRLAMFTAGVLRRPAFGIDFPAQYIQTALDWDDIVLHPSTRDQVLEIKMWLEYGDKLFHDWGMARKLRPGYRSIFFGQPGTGKTMTAGLLGNRTGGDV
jgi:hypothetical protein